LLQFIIQDGAKTNNDQSTSNPRRRRRRNSQTQKSHRQPEQQRKSNQKNNTRTPKPMIAAEIIGGTIGTAITATTIVLLTYPIKYTYYKITKKEQKPKIIGNIALGFITTLAIIGGITAATI